MLDVPTTTSNSFPFSDMDNNSNNAAKRYRNTDCIKAELMELQSSGSLQRHTRGHHDDLTIRSGSRSCHAASADRTLRQFRRCSSARSLLEDEQEEEAMEKEAVIVLSALTQAVTAVNQTHRDIRRRRSRSPRGLGGLKSSRGKSPRALSNSVTTATAGAGVGSRNSRRPTDLSPGTRRFRSSSEGRRQNHNQGTVGSTRRASRTNLLNLSDGSDHSNGRGPARRRSREKLTEKRSPEHSLVLTRRGSRKSIVDASEESSGGTLTRRGSKKKLLDSSGHSPMRRPAPTSSQLDCSGHSDKLASKGSQMDSSEHSAGARRRVSKNSQMDSSEHSAATRRRVSKSSQIDSSEHSAGTRRRVTKSSQMDSSEHSAGTRRRVSKSSLLAARELSATARTTSPKRPELSPAAKRRAERLAAMKRVVSDTDLENLQTETHRQTSSVHSPKCATVQKNASDTNLDAFDTRSEHSSKSKRAAQKYTKRGMRPNVDGGKTMQGVKCAEFGTDNREQDFDWDQDFEWDFECDSGFWNTTDNQKKAEGGRRSFAPSNKTNKSLSIEEITKLLKNTPKKPAKSSELTPLRKSVGSASSLGKLTTSPRKESWNRLISDNERSSTKPSSTQNASWGKQQSPTKKEGGEGKTSYFKELVKHHPNDFSYF
mmetsp:Transcript_6229/g.10734  ORF Transcript_6229/g.10734 Transcript_6229/m.10734 type:complete len:654 (+) Transcript_6229:77-2038(+)